MNLLKNVLVLFGILLVSNGVMAQESVNSAGGNAAGTGGFVSYSIGQVAISAQSSAFGSITEGVQQPYEIVTLVGKDNAWGISLSAFPNPTKDHITIEVSNFISTKILAFSLSDVAGKTISTGNLSDSKTSLSLESLTPGVYFVTVSNEEGTITTHKIIKN